MSDIGICPDCHGPTNYDQHWKVCHNQRINFEQRQLMDQAMMAVRWITRHITDDRWIHSHAKAVIKAVEDFEKANPKYD